MTEQPTSETTPSFQPEPKSSWIGTSTSPLSGQSKIARFKHWYGSHKKWAIPATVLVFILIIFALPWTRYPAAGLVLKKDYAIKVIDSESGSPVSGASVRAGSFISQTDGSGKAILRMPVGPKTFSITKKHYKNGQLKTTVPVLVQKDITSVKLTATGRQVKITIKNLINKKSLANVSIKVADITAKTDKDGNALIVLPAGTAQEQATLSLGGYNDAKVTIKISDKTIAQNDYSLTPTGKIYFLSKQSGKIDVVKTNLDGTGRATALAGTGREDDSGTVLLATRDWKYLALLAKRDGGSPKLYMIDTGNDQLSVIDEGNADFTPVGWSDNYFIYVVKRQNYQPWQNNAQALKSFNAANKQITVLDQAIGEGSDQTDWRRETYGSVYAIGKTVIYEKVWDSYVYDQSLLNDKEAGIYSIGVTGTNASALKRFGYATAQDTYLNSVPYEADQILYDVMEKSERKFLAYTDSKLTSRADIADDIDSYYQNRATYLVSPAGSETFWVEQRDGKNTLLVGNQSGANAKPVAVLADYLNYGWYSDEYLLASKNSSELYILPKAGLGEKDSPLKISDYHKPVNNYYGYGGGYGGI